MSGLRTYPTVYLVDANEVPVGFIGIDGREWLFPASLVLTANAGNFIGNCPFLFAADNTPYGYIGRDGGEYGFPSACTLNTTRGYRMQLLPELYDGTGLPVGVYAKGLYYAHAVSLTGGSGPAQPLRFVSASNRYPSLLMATTAAQTYQQQRVPFVIGSGNVSEIRVVVVNRRLAVTTGSIAIPNAINVDRVAIEYNATWQPVTFSGSRTAAVASGGILISDPIPASNFSLANFARSSTGFVRQRLYVNTGGTDSLPSSGSSGGTPAYQRRYDPSKVNWTNDIDSTGAMTYTMINGGINGTDALDNNDGVHLILIGKYVSGDPPVIVFTGDSKCRGTGDTTANFSNVFGAAHCLVSDLTTGAGAISGLNMGCASGAAIDWQAGTLSWLTDMLAYGTHGYEQYGTNSGSIADSQFIHTKMRAASYRHIIRASLTARSTSTDNWATAVNQTPIAGWSNGGSRDLLEQGLKALVASDFTYYELKAGRAEMQGGSHWLWNYDGTANKYTGVGDGTHETSFAYEENARNVNNVLTTVGPVSNAGDLRTFVAALT